MDLSVTEPDQAQGSVRACLGRAHTSRRLDKPGLMHKCEPYLIPSWHGLDPAQEQCSKVPSKGTAGSTDLPPIYSVSISG